MNQKAKTQEKNKFSKLRLRGQTSRSNKIKTCSPHPQEKISSYFSVLNETEIVSEPSSQVSDTIQTVVVISSEIYDDDFTEQKIIKVTKPETTKSTIVNKNVRKQKIPTEKYAKSDTNQEHLQLALALSKSISDLENPSQEEDVVENTQHKMIRVKQTLDQFGFKTDKAPASTSTSKTNVRATKNKKFKYFTPTLFLRNEEDRTKLIESKVSQIINNISIYNNTIQNNQIIVDSDNNKPRSFILRDYYSEEPIIFKKNALQQENNFYNKTIEPSKVEVGVLLKDWLCIPGREATPPPETTQEPPPETPQEPPPETTQEPIEISMSPEIEIISMSPELFDEEEPIQVNIINNYRDSSETQISKEIMESEDSTKSISLLEIRIKRPENHESSLSPFPDLEIPQNKSIIIRENEDSLSPFEDIVRTPPKKVTPKKQKPSPKPYVVTPKGRKTISPIIKKKSPNLKSRRSIIFTANPPDPPDPLDPESEICHYESFCNDEIECFDLTHSSDDDLGLETNKSLSVTQILEDLSPSKTSSNTSKPKEIMTYDTQASIETMKLNISQPKMDDYSPEFDCLDTSNNKMFYDSFVSPNTSLTKRTSSLFHRSFSDNCLGNKTRFNDSRRLSLSEELDNNDALSISANSDLNISDEELNYSCFNVPSIDDYEVMSVSDENLDHENLNHEPLMNKSLLKHSRVSQMIKSLSQTPCKDFIINSHDVTPKGHYSDMDTPERNQELEKFGLKPMKRNKGVKILHYIYDSTHPVLSNDGSDDENCHVTKRRKTINNELNHEKLCKVDHKIDEITESEKIDDMIFERKQSSKISSCRLPLHVAWHNLYINSMELQENILTYKPVQVEEIYEQFKSFGYKYHIQDIIAFLDKKCITIRIAQKSRNQKKSSIK